MPNLPMVAAPTSLRMSPGKFSMTSTSKWPGPVTRSYQLIAKASGPEAFDAEPFRVRIVPSELLGRRRPV